MKKLEDLLGKAKNRILRIGIELEGGWVKLPPGIPRLEHDGSVRGLEVTVAKPLTQVGELASPPLFADAKLAERAGEPHWKTWLKKCYPHAVNATCGMHVHMSFRNPLIYQRLMIPEYQKEVIKEFTRWATTVKLPLDHPIWDRLRGKSEYCQHRFEPELQSRRKEKGHNRHERGNRYTAINYCYGTHSTMECRLLPMMQEVEQAESAIQFLLDLTNAFYVVHAKPELPQTISLIADESSLEEEVRSCA